MPGSARERERGQLLAFFAIAMVAITGMTGLVIDGGSTFVQRREQQNVTDAAALGAGYAGLFGAGRRAAARSVATANGYTDGVNGVSVNISLDDGKYVTVDIVKPHQNYFAGVLGFGSWNVGTTATAMYGIPNGALGVMPIIFNQRAFYQASNRSSDTAGAFVEPGTGSNDIPMGTNNFNWTVFCVAAGNTCNGDSSTVDGIINGSFETITVWLDELIGPLNAGSHSTLFSDLSNHIGEAFPVAIVNDSGGMVGWALFHLTGSVGGSTKAITGWFDPKVNAVKMTISGNHAGATSAFGSYIVELVN